VVSQSHCIGVIRQATHDFLLDFHCNYVSVLYGFRDIITYLRKIKRPQPVWPVISTLLLKLKDFSMSQTVTSTVKVVISQKPYRLETLLLQIG